MPDKTVSTTAISATLHSHNPKTHGSLDADIIIKNAPDPVFVSDLEGKILSANDAVYELLGFRTDEVLEQSLSRFISPEKRVSLRLPCVRSSNVAQREMRVSIRAVHQVRSYQRV